MTEFRLELIAEQGEMDQLGHISNVAYVRWIQEVAMAHSMSVGYSLHAYQALGAVFVVRRHEIDYLRPIFAGDRVVLTTWVDKWMPASSLRKTVISRGDDGSELARAVTQWVLVSTEGGRPRKIPAEMRQAFS